MADVLEAQREGRAAFLAMQKALPPVRKETEAHGYMYADLPTLLSAVLPVLHQHDLAVFWEGEEGPGGKTEHSVRCIVEHAPSGWQRTSCMSIDWAAWEAPRNMSAPQKLGAVVTYLRRYTLQDVLGFTPDVDPDCQGAPEAPSTTDPWDEEPPAGAGALWYTSRALAMADAPPDVKQRHHARAEAAGLVWDGNARGGQGGYALPPDDAKPDEGDRPAP